MTITVIATAEFEGGAGSGGTTGSFDSTGANCIAVFLAYGGSPTVSDSKGNTYSTGTANTNIATGRWYYCLGATVGTGHTVTIGGGATASSCTVLALAGVATSSAYTSPGATDFNSVTSDAFGVDYTPASDGSIILAGLAHGTATISSVSAGSGWTLAQWATGVGGTNYGNIVSYKIQTTATQVPAAETVASWTGSSSGTHIVAIFAPGAAAPTLTIDTPSAFEVHQRSGTTGSIQITGSVTGATEDIEASFNGGAYVTIATAVAAGSFSGTLASQAQGQGTLTVRKKTTTSASATVANVGIGDVFVVGGDSISEGRGTNPQSYSHATLKAAKFTQADAWGEGNDGIDTGTSSGSHWPLLATQIMASQGVPVAFISVGTGSTDVAGSANTWAKPGAEYTELTSQVTASTVAGVKGVLMHLGPNAVVNASTLSQATYNAALDTLASNLAADVAGAPKLCLGIFGEVSTGSPPDRTAALNNLRAAIIEAHGDNANIKPGPVLIDLDYSDGVHPQSDAHLQAVAKRWWVALSETFYSGSGGRGPRKTLAAWNGARNQLTVTFDRNLKTGLTHSTACWAVSDNGTPMTVSSVAYHGTNAAALVITTSAAAVGASGTTTISFASGDTAVGVVVPLSADITMPSGAAIQIPAEPFYAQAVSEVDTTAPVLTSPAGSQITSTTADCSVTTDEGNGTLYVVVTTSATPPASASGAGFVAGTYPYSSSVIVSSTGTKTFTATGLSPSTTYYAHFKHNDATGNESSIVSSASFTTTAASGALSDAEFREMYEYVIALAKINGLVSNSPMTVSATGRSAGGVVQTFSTASGTTTVTRTS